MMEATFISELNFKSINLVDSSIKSEYIFQQSLVLLDNNLLSVVLLNLVWYFTRTIMSTIFVKHYFREPDDEK